jgi:hypothetical protein
MPIMANASDRLAAWQIVLKERKSRGVENLAREGPDNIALTADGEQSFAIGVPTSFAARRPRIHCDRATGNDAIACKSRAIRRTATSS